MGEFVETPSTSAFNRTIFWEIEYEPAHANWSPAALLFILSFWHISVVCVRVSLEHARVDRVSEGAKTQTVRL